MHFWGCITPFGTRLSKLRKSAMQGIIRVFSRIGSFGCSQSGKFWINIIDDNCPIHRAGILNDRKIGYGLEILPWPARSPYLNPIENVWAYVKRQLGAMLLHFEDLEQNVTDIWDKIRQKFIHNSYKSMPKRSERVLGQQGMSHPILIFGTFLLKFLKFFNKIYSSVFLIACRLLIIQCKFRT